MKEKTPAAKLAAILKGIGRPQKDPNAAAKQKAAFDKLLAAFSQPLKDLFSQAFMLARDCGREASRPDPEACSSAMRALAQSGQPGVAEALFFATAPAFAGVPEEKVALILPTPKAVEAWIKSARIPATRLARTTLSAPEKFYPTALADWFCSKALPIQVLPFARMAARAAQRPAFLPVPALLLRSILKRDKKGLLSATLLREAATSEGCVLHLLQAVRETPAAWGLFAAAYTSELQTSSGDADIARLLSPLEELLVTPRHQAATFASAFLAHVITTLAVRDALKTPRTPTLPAQFVRLTNSILLAAQKPAAPPLLIAASAREIIDRLLPVKGKVSQQGAMELAVALQAVDRGLEAHEAFRSAAFNLGLRESGEPGTGVSYDPLLHESAEGGLVPGDTVTLTRPGLAFEGATLIRAHVEKRERGTP